MQGVFTQIKLKKKSILIINYDDKTSNLFILSLVHVVKADENTNKLPRSA